MRGHLRGKGVLNALVDLPLALSPIVVGLSLLISVRPRRLARPVAQRPRDPGRLRVTGPRAGDDVRLPPVRRAGGRPRSARDRHGAGAGRVDARRLRLQIFRRVTLPAIRWGVVYGVVLTTARCLGEFGAVSVVSGNIEGKTETMTLYVENQYQGFNTSGAYAASVVLALLSVVTLVAMTLFRRKEESSGYRRPGNLEELRDVRRARGHLDRRAGGSLTALLGPSGSGKSTLLRVIAGLERPDAGRVLLDGADVTALTPQRRGVGFVFQHYAAFRHMTVYENVAFGMRVRKRPKAEIKERVGELLKLVQLEAFGKRYPAQLSGGQRQRMGLARALAVDPAVLLLDEPFGALDARVRKELRIWLRRLHDETHTTTLIVTHDQEEAMDVADQIVLMNHGKVEQTGDPRDLYEHPANEFVMGFVGPVNRIGESYVRAARLRAPAPSERDDRPRRWSSGSSTSASRCASSSCASDGEQLSVQISRDEAHAARARARTDRLHRARCTSGRSSSRTERSVRGPGARDRGRAPRPRGKLAAADVGDRDRLEHRAQVRADGDPDVLELAPPSPRTPRPAGPRRGRSRSAPRRRGSPRPA